MEIIGDGVGTESRGNLVMGRPCLTPPITQKAVTPMNLCSCHRRTDACPLPLSEGELTTRASFFLLVTKRLHVGLSATWLMISGKKKRCFFLPQRKHQPITWHSLTLIIQLIEPLTFIIRLNVIHTNRYFKG